MSIITIINTKTFKNELFQIFDNCNIGLKTISDKGNLTEARIITNQELEHDTICDLVNLCARHFLEMKIKRSGAGIRIQFHKNEDNEGN